MYGRLPTCGNFHCLKNPIWGIFIIRTAPMVGDELLGNLSIVVLNGVPHAFCSISRLINSCINREG